MSWDEFWSWFTNQSSEIKKDALLQLDLVDMMKRISIEERRNVLKCAPQSVIDRLQLLLRGYYDKDKQTVKYSLRGFSR
jgi:hypothetical protein